MEVLSLSSVSRARSLREPSSPLTPVRLRRDEQGYQDVPMGAQQDSRRRESHRHSSCCSKLTRRPAAYRSRRASPSPRPSGASLPPTSLPPAATPSATSRTSRLSSQTTFAAPGRLESGTRISRTPARLAALPSRRATTLARPLPRQKEEKWRMRFGRSTPSR